MRKAIIYIISAAMLLLAGCGLKKEGTGVTPDFTFELPEGYSITQISDTQCDILSGEVKIGAIVFTTLNPNDIEDTGDNELHLYLNSYGPPPLICEHISMLWESHISVTMKITDPGTNATENTQHHIYERKKAVYDLWLNTDLVNDEAIEKIVKTAGIKY